METPRTLLEAVTYFSDPDRAHAYAVKQRWPYGVACPRPGCGSANVLEIKGRRTWKCRECKRQFSVKVGTIFEQSPLPLTKWLPAVWLLTNTKNGTSSCELARALGITQKSAWFMFHRIRLALKTSEYAEKLSGYVEADETYIGGKMRNKRGNVGNSVTGKKAPGPTTNKTVVMGMIERGGRARAWVVPNTRGATLMPRIRAHITPGSTVYTDANNSYHDVSRDYVHQVIDHAVRYVEGQVHTNSIENFWSCLKRTLGGTYICARPWHLDAYLDEQVFRFNARDGKDADRFAEAMKGVEGRRLTYARLISANPQGKTVRASGPRRVHKSRHDAQSNPVI